MKRWWCMGMALALGACGDPCKDLSQKVCSCERTVDERAACQARIGNLASQWQPNPNKRVEQAGREVCAALIEGCTCSALAAGNLQACGLSTEQ